MMAESVSRLCEQHCQPAVLHCAEQGEFPAALWARLGGAGVFHLLVDEERGGVGAGIADTAATLAVLGSFAAPGPIVEAIVANFARCAVGLPPLEDPQSLAVAENGRSSASGVAGAVAAPSVRWGRQVDSILFACGGEAAGIAEVTPANAEFSVVPTLSSEPALRMVIPSSDHSSTSVPPPFIERLVGIVALGRCAEAVGAIQWMLTSSLSHAQERSQFGRLIAKFQAVQQMLAELAAEASAADAICNAACELADVGDWTLLPAAVVRILDAIDRSVEIAHQVHGAIGFSKEHGLNFRTRRAMQWCNDATLLGPWGEMLGDQILAAKDAGLWEVLVSLAEDEVVVSKA